MPARNYGTTAQASDLTAGFGTFTVSIPANTFSVTIDVRIVPDSTPEPDEVFFVQLTDVDPLPGALARAYLFADNEGEGTIENNDP